MFSFIFENWYRSHMHPGVVAESNGVGRGVLVNFNRKHLITYSPHKAPGYSVPSPSSTPASW